jgi:PRTRC genetic system protein E
MFTELMPLIQNRALTITVAAVDATQIRVNVVPQSNENDKKANDQIGHTHSKEVAKIPDEAIQGLTTPLSLTGTPQELDADLVSTLAKFTALHAGLQQSFETAATAIRDSVKAIDERERLKREKDKANAKKPAAPKAEEKRPTEEATLPSLFTTQGENRPAAVSANDAPTLPEKEASASAEDQSDQEEESQTCR